MLTNHQTLAELMRIEAKLQAILSFMKDWQQTRQAFDKKVLSPFLSARYLTYSTTSEEERDWEAHKKDIDVHILIAGAERIAIADAASLVAGPYHEQDDYYLLTGESQGTIELTSENNIALFFQNEPHKTGISYGEKERIEKIVFKIRK